jgi:hypothetical protein
MRLRLRPLPFRCRIGFKFFLIGLLFFLGCTKSTVSAQAFPPGNSLLAGGEKGLYIFDNFAKQTPPRLAWEGGAVDHIAYSSKAWYFLGPKGVVYSENLVDFEDRSAGLPKKTLRVFENGAWSLASSIATLKDIAVDPQAPERVAVCTDTEVWFSENSGKSWASLGSPSAIPGMKALAFGPSEKTDGNSVWVAHAFRGVYAFDAEGTKNWAPKSAGLPRIFGNNMEEISGFAWIPTREGRATFVVGTTFKAGIFAWNPESRVFNEIYSSGGDWGSLESIHPWGEGSGFAIQNDEIVTIQLSPQNPSSTVVPLPEGKAFFENLAQALFLAANDSPRSLALLPRRGDSLSQGNKPVVLEELWRLKSPRDGAKDASRRQKAARSSGLYLQTGFLIDREKRSFYFDLMKRKNLDHIVVDVKDDYGKLRFSPRSSLLRSWGTQGNVLNLEEFAAEAKARGIYLVARVVVFKDEALHTWNNGALAVKDRRSKGPWRGIASNGQPIREHWVDPFSQEVWAYNVEIAREVIERGFDEVQFDYIRFPTDGANLGDAVYPSKSPGMSQDDALESFLRFARSRIEAPISVDIYGANGWYRSGTRTGQNVEMMVPYVDVICPMLYPSHFEQEFLAFPPPEQRPYRIYRLGTLRNLAIARNQVLIRPYVQAFYLDVAYDRTYYNPAYVAQEIRGVKEGANHGFTYWNNSGRYDDIP